jgi:hypothetical protein
MPAVVLQAGVACASFVTEIWSGAERHRPGLDTLLDSLLPGDTVLAHDLDRLSRGGQVDTALVIDRVESTEASVAFVIMEFDRTETGAFLRSTRAFLSALEREKIAERTQRGRHARVRSGKLNAAYKPPFGYRWADPDTKKGGKREVGPGAGPGDGSSRADYVRPRARRRAAARDREPAYRAGHPLAVWRRSLVAHHDPRNPGEVRLNRDRNGVLYRYERKPGGKYKRRPATPEEQIAVPEIAPAVVSKKE